MSEMKKAISVLLVSMLCFCCLSFSGCSENKYADHLDEYISTLEYHDGFTVLQLTDIHWSTSTRIGDDHYGEKRYITKVIEEAKKHSASGKIDLLEITGDTFMLANTLTVNSFFDFIESLEIPYAITWGNHDRQGKFNPNWLSDKVKNLKYSLYREVDNDDVAGRSNYVVNLVSGGDVKWQIINLDSGASYRAGAGDLALTYDYLRDSQFEWLEAIHGHAGAGVPAIAYYHIAQADNDLCWDTIKETGYKNKFFKLEGFAKSDYAPETFDIFARNNVKAAFQGHAHAVDWTVTKSEGGKEVTYGLGVKTGKELYYGTIDHTSAEARAMGIDEDIDLIGASLVTLNDDSGSYTLEHLYLNERPSGDYIKWVEY